MKRMQNELYKNNRHRNYDNLRVTDETGGTAAAVMHLTSLVVCLITRTTTI